MKYFRELVNSWVIPPPGGWKCHCGVELDFPGVCDACAEERRTEEAVARISSEVATIPVRFRWATFDDPELRQRCKTDLRKARKALQDLFDRKIQNLVLLGAAGAGKSSLACAMLQSALYEEVVFSGRFCAAVTLAACRTDSGLGTIPPALYDAMCASLIVLDDVGQEPERNAPVITELMQHRYNDGKPTIVTTWLSPAEVAQRYSAGTARRFFEHSAIVRLS